MIGTTLERFVDKYVPEPNSGCWLWTAFTNEGGYGRFRVNGIYRAAHRASYELFVGPIPKGLVIDHLCRVRCCVNPDHLEAVTQRENTLRGEGIAGRSAKRTHCLRHPKQPMEFLYPTANRRRCRLCRRASECIRMRQYRAKLRAA